MTCLGVPAVLGEVDPDIRVAIGQCVEGLLRRMPPLAIAEPPLRCVLVTSDQWRMALYDSGVSAASRQLDQCAARFLESRHMAGEKIGQRMPRLVGELAAANANVQSAVSDLGRFEPPPADSGAAAAVAEIGRLSRDFVTAVLQCAVEGLSEPRWTIASDHLRERDHLIARHLADDDDDPDADDLRLERSLGLSTAKLSSGDGLTFASRVAAAWSEQPEVLDGRLHTQLPHLLDPAVPLSSRVRLHLTQLSASHRPFVAHQAAVAARDLVLRALAANPTACLGAVAEAASHEPIMYATHRGLVEAVRAYNLAPSAQARMRPALQMYTPVMEGDIRRVSRIVLRLLGCQVSDRVTLGELAERLAALKEPMCVLLGSCIRPAWRNAIAHEEVSWDSAAQRAILAGEPAETRLIADAALRAHEICAGFEAGVAVALNRAGNPHERGAATANEIARSVNTLLALGEAGITVSELHREGATLRLQVGQLTIENMPHLLGGLILASRHMPEVQLWDIRQPGGRIPWRISAEGVTAALSLSDTDGDGHQVIEMPISGLPLIFSGLRNYEPNSTATAPSTIALAAVNIIGERDRLASQLAAGDRQALGRLLQTLMRTARAVEAATTLAQPDDQQLFQAFSRLIHSAHRQLTTAGPVAGKAALSAIQVAFRSSAPARLPWLDDQGTVPDDGNEVDR
jgi:hypothetical protein